MKTNKNALFSDQKRFSHFYRILPRNLVDAILAEKSYPLLNAYIHGSNPLVTYTNTSRVYQAFKKLDFMVISGVTQYRKYEKNGFATPSGKVKLFSDRLVGFQYKHADRRSKSKRPGDRF